MSFYKCSISLDLEIINTQKFSVVFLELLQYVSQNSAISIVLNFYVSVKSGSGSKFNLDAFVVFGGNLHLFMRLKVVGNSGYYKYFLVGNSLALCVFSIFILKRQCAMTYQIAVVDALKTDIIFAFAFEYEGKLILFSTNLP